MAANSVRLTCVECGREQAADERGWQAHLTVDEDEPAEAVVYCPECGTREFGRRGGGESS
jgi:DNA-directed RNA polymerase subunit RPC12/RpoP